MEQRLIAKHYRSLNKSKMTPSERVVKTILKNNLIIRQNRINHMTQHIFKKPNGFYIADFYVGTPYRVVIEIDGKHHLARQINYDVKRTLDLELNHGVKVIRFRNDEVFKPDFESILVESILKLKNHWINFPGIPPAYWNSFRRENQWKKRIAGTTQGHNAPRESHTESSSVTLIA